MDEPVPLFLNSAPLALEAECPQEDTLESDHFCLVDDAKWTLADDAARCGAVPSPMLAMAWIREQVRLVLATQHWRVD